MDDAYALFLCKYLELSGKEWQLLVLLCALADEFNLCHKTATELAALMSTSRSRIMESLRTLREAGLVCRVPAKANMIYHMVTPELLCKGSPAVQRIVDQKWDRYLALPANQDVEQGVMRLEALEAEFDVVQQEVLERRSVS